MKSWIKKVKRLFSGTSSKRETDGYTPSIMSERSAHRARRRDKKCPDFPTYRAAENWIKENRFLLEQTLDMIDIYPELVKQPACSKLVHFMAECGIKANNKPNGHTSSTSDDSYDMDKYDNEESEHPETNIPVPEILVSHAQEDDMLCSSRSPTVFICGNMDDTNWHRLLVGLSRVYSVHCFSTKHSLFNQSIQLSDIFVFLMDETSVNDSRFTEQLRAAITKGIEIVYVRDMSFELQEPREFSRYSSRTTHVSQTIQSKTLTNSLTDFKCCQKQSRRYSIDNFSIESDDSTNHVFPVIKTCTLNTEHMDTLSATTLDRRPSTPKQSFDIAKILRLEYGTANGYHQIYHEQCLERIVIAIDSKMHVVSRPHSSSAFSTASTSSPNTRVSMYSSVSNDSAIDDMYRSLTPETTRAASAKPGEREPSEDDINLPSSLHTTSTETVFLIASETTDNKPMVFRWPADASDCRSIISSPSIDSFGFQDIDLSKRINELDLFEPAHSDHSD